MLLTRPCVLHLFADSSSKRGNAPVLEKDIKQMILVLAPFQGKGVSFIGSKEIK